MAAARTRWLVGTVLLLAAAVSLSAQEGVEEDGHAWLNARTAEFAEYDQVIGTKSPAHLRMEPRSLLNWANAERQADVGALFVWTDEGQPALIACAFGRGKGLRHEFHSLSTEPIVARRRGAEVHRFTPGIAWQELPASPSPAGSRVLRLVQMRRQAERFEVTLGRAERTEMRLLRQPVFRSGGDGFPDTSVFVYVQGTDPECVLMLRAADEKSWQFSLTRQTKWALQASLDGTMVLDLAAIGNTNKQAEAPFHVLVPPAATE
jgi:hypothetical protein